MHQRILILVDGSASVNAVFSDVINLTCSRVWMQGGKPK